MRAKLGEIFEISSGGTPSKSHPEYYGGNIPWVKTGDLKKEYLDEVENYITEEGLNNSSAKMYEADTVLIAMYGATIGATSILKMNACTNQACAAFKKSEQVIPEYLYFFLRSQKEKFVKDGVGGAQPNISVGYLKKVKMEIPSLNEQKVIVDVLDQISDVIVKRNQEILSLEELIRARFVEMFGDPISNPKGFICKRGKNLFTFSSGKFLEEKKRMIEGIPVYGGNGIVWHTADPLIKTSTIVIGRVGAYCGNVRMITEAAWITDNAIYIKEFKTADFELRFLYELMQYMNFSQFADFSGQPKITQKPLESLQYIVPSIELQEQFTDFVTQIDKSKFHTEENII